MDIKTAIEVIKSLPPDISVLICGDHGIGKSEIVAQLARAFDARLLDRRMSQCSEGDTVGLPKQTFATGPDGKQYDITQFCPPEFVALAKMQRSFLFLDELNRATPEVMQACFQYALDRCDFQGEKFHPETRVLAAINTGGNYQVNDLDPALIDRFYVIDLKPSAEDFFEHAEARPAELGGPLDPDLIRFLRAAPSRLDPARGVSKDRLKVEPSRRSWVRLDRVFKLNKVYEQNLGENAEQKGRAYSLALGLVGIEASSDLVDYLSRRETRFEAKHVLDEYPKHRANIQKLSNGKFIDLIDQVILSAQEMLWTKEQAVNLGLFAQDVPAELRVSILVSFVKNTREHANFLPNFKMIQPEVTPHVVLAYNPEAKFDASTGIDPNAGKKTAKSKKDKASK
jgi:MoxR-like ATPase